MSQIGTRAVLAGAGTILCVIGGAFMLVPQTFLAMGEVFVDKDPGLMSEVTAQTGLLVITGIFMMLSAVKLRFANVSLICGALVYGSYGLSRLVSMQLHGLPSDTLIVVAYFELGVAVLLGALAVRNLSSEPLMAESFQNQNRPNH